MVDTIEDLVAGMNRAADDDVPALEVGPLRELIEARDSEMDNDFTKDAQITAIRGARHYRGDKLMRVTRRTLGGLETDLSCRCLTSDGPVLPGLFAAGAVMASVAAG